MAATTTSLPSSSPPSTRPHPRRREDGIRTASSTSPGRPVKLLPMPPSSKRKGPPIDPLDLDTVPDDFEDALDDFEEGRHLVKNLPNDITDLGLSQSTNVLANGVDEGNPDASVHTLPVTERLHRSREERHLATLELMDNELLRLRMEFEGRVSKISSETLSKITAHDGKFDADWVPFLDNDILEQFVWDDLQRAMDLSLSAKAANDSCIQFFSKELERIERERMAEVGELLKYFGKQLKSIAFLLPDQVDAFLAQEAQILNLEVIENKRSFLDVESRLSVAEVEKLKSRHVVWEDRHCYWKAYSQKQHVAKFTSFCSREGISMQQRQEILGRLEEVLTMWTSRHLTLLSAIDSYDVVSFDIEHVASELAVHASALHAISSSYVSELRSHSESIIEEFEQRLQYLRVELLRSHVCGPDEAEAIVSGECQPLVRQIASENETFASALSDALKQMLDSFVSFHRETIEMSKKVALRQTEHHAYLEQRQKNLNDKIEKCRMEHENKRQSYEGHINSLIDSLRQAPTMPNVQIQLDAILRQFNSIEAVYHQFNSDATAIIKNYPYIVTEAYKEYYLSFCGLFHVKKRKGESNRQLLSNLAATPSSLGADLDPTRLHHGDDDTLITLSDGTVYVIKEHSLVRTTSKHRISSAAIVAVAGKLAPFLRALELPPDHEKKIFATLRRRAVEYVHAYYARSSDDIEAFVGQKLQDLAAETSLFSMLHRKRVRHVEEDVANVRLAEMKLHHQLVKDHCKGGETLLKQLKDRFKEFKGELDAESASFLARISIYESELRTLKSTTMIQATSDEAKNYETEYKERARSRLMAYRQELDEQLFSIRDSNGQLRTSFKTFSEGGNYSKFEVEEFTKALQAFSVLIDETESSVARELDGMESHYTHSLTGTKMHEFHTKQSLATKDMAFVEAVKKHMLSFQNKVHAEVTKVNNSSADIDSTLASYQELFNGPIDPFSNLDSFIDQTDYILGKIRNHALFLDCVHHDEPLSPYAPLREATARSPSKAKPKRSTSKSFSSLVHTRMSIVGGLARTLVQAKEKNKIKLLTGGRIVLESWEGGLGRAESFNHHIGEAKIDCRAAIVDLCVAYYEKTPALNATRPALISENPQAFMDNIQEQLKATHAKSQVFLEKSIMEFADQVVQFHDVVFSKVISGWFSHVVVKNSDSFKLEASQLSQTTIELISKLRNEGIKLQAQLRPNLGSETNKVALDALCAAQASRFESLRAGLVNANEALYAAEKKSVDTNAKDLQEATSMLLALCDMTLRPAHLNLPKPTVQKKTVKEILSEQLANEGASNPSSKLPSSSTDHETPMPEKACLGIDKFCLPSDAKTAPMPLQECFTQNEQDSVLVMNTPLHDMVVSRRDAVRFEVCSLVHGASLSRVAMFSKEIAKLEGELRQWNASVDALKSLHLK